LEIYTERSSLVKGSFLEVASPLIIEFKFFINLFSRSLILSLASEVVAVDATVVITPGIFPTISPETTERVGLVSLVTRVSETCALVVNAFLTLSDMFLTGFKSD